MNAEFKYLIRIGEIFLKGKNRHFFEQRLINNIKEYLKSKETGYSIIPLRNRIYLETDKEVNLKYVFGMASYSPVCVADANYDSMVAVTDKMTLAFNSKTKFRISSKRITKDFPISSLDLNKRLGNHVVNKTNARVSLTDCDIDVGIEILSNKAYISTEKINCFGGLPVGVSGCAGLLLDDKDSVLAGLLMMKRGCTLKIFSSKERVDRTELLEKYSSASKTNFFYFKNLKDLINMLGQNNVSTMILGNTFKNLKKVPVGFVNTLYPLIGFTDVEIKKELRKYS